MKTGADITILLRSPQKAEYFLQFLKEEFPPNKIEFFISCSVFKEAVSGGKQDILKEAETLWEDFFSDKKVYTLNLPEEIVNQISQKIQQKQVTPNLFDEAKNYIFDSFPVDVIEAFTKSNHLVKLCFEDDLNRKSTKEN